MKLPPKLISVFLALPNTLYTDYLQSVIEGILGQNIPSLRQVCAFPSVIDPDGSELPLPLIICTLMTLVIFACPTTAVGLHGSALPMLYKDGFFVDRDVRAMLSPSSGRVVVYLREP